MECHLVAQMINGYSIRLIALLMPHKLFIRRLVTVVRLLHRQDLCVFPLMKSLI